MTRSETVRNVIEEFDLRRAADEREYDARLAELSEKIPGLAILRTPCHPSGCGYSMPR